MDLTTQYMGLKLKNPIVASASPLSYKLDGIRKLEDAGAATIVMHSLFEEQINEESKTLDHYLSFGTDSFAEALSYFPEQDDFNVGPDEYLELISAAKKAVGIPVIGSLNGVSKGGWTRYARMIQAAGADALELNIYYIPTDPMMSGAQVEEMYLDTIRDVKSSITIPVAVKVGPFFSNMANMANQMVKAGADALVLFNRFYQPDMNLEKLEVEPDLVLSNSVEMRLPLRWIAILYGRISCDFALTSGIHTPDDVLKAMMAGANCAQMASELLLNGTNRIGNLLAGISSWMEEYEYSSITQMRGSMSQRNVAEPAAFERANYMKVLHSYREDPSGQRL
jgi:dihydroorotate dehydrogenase (fumarate)